MTEREWIEILDALRLLAFLLTEPGPRYLTRTPSVSDEPSSPSRTPPPITTC